LNQQAWKAYPKQRWMGKTIPRPLICIFDKFLNTERRVFIFCQSSKRTNRGIFTCKPFNLKTSFKQNSGKSDMGFSQQRNWVNADWHGLICWK